MTETAATRRERLENALWGLFIGDALAMPAHWYYSLDNLRRDFPEGLGAYHDAPHPHPESFMVGMDYTPDTASALACGRPYDILHEHARFYATNYSQLDIGRGDRETEHGHDVPAPEQRYHYHHGLKAGENTLGAHLVRVLLRSVVERGRYEPGAFLQGFVDHMTVPGRNRDPYTEIYIRRWFENYSRCLPAESCAASQRQFWSIAAHGGVIRPLVLAMASASAYQGLGLAVEHMHLTHRSENNASALSVLAPLAHDLLDGHDVRRSIEHHAKRVRVPRITGEELFAAYRDHHGPQNIEHERMWRMHTELRDEPFDVETLAENAPESEVVRARFATACYPEHGLPLLLYLHHRHGAMRAALAANAEAGGDNVHRGMLLGLLAGAADTADTADDLRQGLADHDALRVEIEAFSELAATGPIL